MGRPSKLILAMGSAPAPMPGLPPVFPGSYPTNRGTRKRGGRGDLRPSPLLLGGEGAQGGGRGRRKWPRTAMGAPIAVPGE